MGDLLEDFGEKPSDGVWKSIEGRLDTLPAEKTKRQAVPLRVLLPVMGAAAALLLGVFLFTRNGALRNPHGQIVVDNEEPFGVAVPPDSAPAPSVEVDSPLIAEGSPTIKDENSPKSSPVIKAPSVRPLLSDAKVGPFVPGTGKSTSDGLISPAREPFYTIPSISGGVPTGEVSSTLGGSGRIPRSITAPSDGTISPARPKERTAEDNSRIWARISSGGNPAPAGKRGAFSIETRGNFGIGADAQGGEVITRDGSASFLYPSYAPSAYYNGGFGSSYGGKDDTNTKATNFRSYDYYAMSGISNVGPVKGTFSHSLPLKTSIMGRYSFPGRLSLEGGVGVLWMKSELSGAGAKITATQELIYVGIPLGVEYSILSGEWWNLYLRAGATGYTLAKIGLRDSANTETKKEQDLLFSVEGGAGVEFTLPLGLSIFAEPQIGWYKGKNTNLEHYYTENPIGLTINAGIRYSFN